MINRALSIAMIAASLAAAACQFSFSTARISDAQMCRAVSEKMEAIGPTSTFNSSDRVIHCLVYVANAPTKTKVRARWILVNVPGATPNNKIGESDVETEPSKNAVDFTFTPRAAGLPAGQYRVDLFLNPQPGKEEQPSKSVTFNVT